MRTQTKEKQTAAKAATPLMRQYLSIKERYKQEIVFFRLGDFYEMFYEDAIKASPILEVALTKRQAVPMCGVPHHAATGYMAKLLKAGLSVALAEQLEDPKKTKGMVKRDVVRVVTPGTIVEDELLSSGANNFLVALSAAKSSAGGHVKWALAAADVSTGSQWVGEVSNDLHCTQLKSHLAALNPSEILLVGESSQRVFESIAQHGVVRYEPLPENKTQITDQVLAAIQNYLKRDHSQAVVSLSDPLPLPTEAAGLMFLDESAIRHLELVNSSDPSGHGPTLLSLLDQCVTPQGSRLLRWRLLHPALSKDVIEDRLKQVQALFDQKNLRDEVRSLLKEVADLERISVRTQTGTVSPRDLGALRHSLSVLPLLEDLAERMNKSESLGTSVVFQAPGVPRDLVNLLNGHLEHDPPIKLSVGGVIKEGVSNELDELRTLRRSGKKWIAEMEAEERQKTGITNLKVGYNDVFGYFLEVSKSHLSKVPEAWIRKQTLTNAERYITPALKEQEEKLLGAESKIFALETQLFDELVRQTAAYRTTISQIAQQVAEFDVVASLAEVSAQNGYVRPSVNTSLTLSIQGGKHPVIEKNIGKDKFIPNPLSLGGESKHIALITGPNMAGKSTYLRQTALIVIMAQMGCFVPAEQATIGLVDRIFTRIGAADRLSQGQSTFMVEMQEVAALLLNASERSLLILDEVGRGTSTYDGVSIAWAVIEYLQKLTPRTLFATHYFELTQLEDRLPSVTNYHATAKEWPGPDGQKRVVFLYQILPGPADKSYGIHVAEMAGVPKECIGTARIILKELEAGSHTLTTDVPKANEQLDFFSDSPLVKELKELDINHLSPLQALNKLSDLKSMLD